MPVSYVAFTAVTTPTNLPSETSVASVQLLRGLLPLTQPKVELNISCNPVRRDRAPKIKPLELIATVQGQFKQWLKFGGGTVTAKFETDVAYFINAVPTAPPKGVMGLASMDRVIDPVVPLVFNGSRLVRGDLVPIFFHVQGQRLTGLEGTFKAKQRRLVGNQPPITFEKTSVIESAPSLDEKTGIEIMTGNFTIDPSDTNSFPDYEVEMGFQFLLSDGQGRTYTVATGYFTVYPPL